MRNHYLMLALIAALWLWPADLGAQSEALITAYERGTELHKAGRYEQATPFFRQAAELSEREFGPEHPTAKLMLSKLLGSLLASSYKDPEIARALNDLREASRALTLGRRSR